MYPPNEPCEGPTEERHCALYGKIETDLCCPEGRIVERDIIPVDEYHGMALGHAQPRQSPCNLTPKRCRIGFLDLSQFQPIVGPSDYTFPP